MRQLARWLSDDGSIYVAVPNAFAKRDQTFQHFHFAHVHTFTPQTLIWAGEAAGSSWIPVSRLRYDDCLPQGAEAGTELAIRQGQVVAAHFSKSDPLLFLLSAAGLAMPSGGCGGFARLDDDAQSIEVMIEPVVGSACSPGGRGMTAAGSNGLSV